MVPVFRANGKMMAEMPRINKIFETLLPIMLATASSVDPWALAKMLTTSSGREVPKATTTRPITIYGILSFLAIEEEPSIKKSAPFIKIASPPASINRFQTIGADYVVYLLTIKSEPLKIIGITAIAYVSDEKSGQVRRMYKKASPINIRPPMPRHFQAITAELSMSTHIMLSTMFIGSKPLTNNLKMHQNKIMVTATTRAAVIVTNEIEKFIFQYLIFIV